MADGIPRKIEPFEVAFKAVERSIQYGGNIHYAAPRKPPHNGIDLGVPEGTPIQVPADRVVLIGITKEKSPAGKSMGNALIFFVPNNGNPYFLALLHLSPKTFQQLRRSHFSIGSEIVSEPGVNTVVAYGGKSGINNSGPHVHVNATTEFMYGGQNYTAIQFMGMYRQDKLEQFLQGKNFSSILPASRLHSNSLAGFLDPTELIRKGTLRFSTQPEQQREKNESTRIALK